MDKLDFVSMIATLQYPGNVACLSETDLAEGDEISHSPKKKQSFRNAERRRIVVSTTGPLRLYVTSR